MMQYTRNQIIVGVLALLLILYFIYPRPEKYNYPPSIPAAYLDPYYNPYYSPYSMAKPQGYKPYEYNKLRDESYLYKRYTHDPNGDRPYVYIVPWNKDTL